MNLKIGWVCWKDFACCISSGQWMRPYYHSGKWVIAAGQGKSKKPLRLFDCFELKTKKDAMAAIKKAIQTKDARIFEKD